MKVGINHKGVMAGVAQHATGDAEFKRQMGCPAAEIDAAVEVPVGIDECYPHARASSKPSPRWFSPNRSVSHCPRSRRPSVTATFGRHPRADEMARISDTYQG